MVRLVIYYYAPCWASAVSVRYTVSISIVPFCWRNRSYAIVEFNLIALLSSFISPYADDATLIWLCWLLNSEVRSIRQLWFKYPDSLGGVLNDPVSDENARTKIKNVIYWKGLTISPFSSVHQWDGDMFSQIPTGAKEELCESGISEEWSGSDGNDTWCLMVRIESYFSHQLKDD